MKIRKVVASSDVGVDLEAGRYFYDQLERGVGDYFFASLISDLESLKLYGGIHTDNFRFYRMLSTRFPFAIYYNIDVDTVNVFAVLDMRRDPAWIRQKLSRRKP